MAFHSSIPNKAVIAAVVTLALCAFGRVVGHGWLQFDDPLHVTDNPHFLPLTWSSLCNFWLRPYEFLYIPVSYMIFAAECVGSRLMTGGGSCAPLRPELFHAVSLGLHLANVLVVDRLLGRLAAARWMAAAGAAVFAVHPLQAESVAWISEQRGLLAALLSLLAVERFLRWLELPGVRSPWRADAVFGIALFALAMLAKPQAVTTPLIALGLGIACGKQPVKTVGMALGPWFVLAAAVAFVTRVSQPVDESMAPVPLLARPTVAADAIAWYATKVVLPVGLCAGYGQSPAFVLADRWTPLVAVATAMVLAAIFFLPRFRAARLPAAIFLSALLPVLGFVSFIFQAQSTVADRYAYVAMLGPAAAVSLSLGQLCSRGVVGKWLLPATGIGIIGLAVIAARQTSTWRDTGTLARHACMIAPDAALPWSLQANHELAMRNGPAARAASRRGLEIDPHDAESWINLGSACALAGDYAEAERAFTTAKASVLTDRQQVGLGSNYGRFLLDTQRNTEAVRAFLAALDRHPRHLAARQGLGVALTRIGELQAASDVFRSVLEDQPANAGAWVGLGNALLLAGEPREAVQCYGQALLIDPNDAAVLANRARALIEVGDHRAVRSDVERLRRMGVPVDDELSAAANEHEPGPAGDE
jgi:Flp pilus assembly protein TadD